MKPRACIVVSSEMTVRNFLVRQLSAMQSDFDVTVVVNTTNPQFLQELGLAPAIEGLVELGMTPSQAIVAATRTGNNVADSCSRSVVVSISSRLGSSASSVSRTRASTVPFLTVSPCCALRKRLSTPRIWRISLT